MARIRKCYSCKQLTLVPLGREMQIYHSVWHYECQQCGETLDLVPAASIGAGITIGGLALAFWGFILFRGAGNPSGAALIVYGAAFLALAIVWLPPILIHIQCPPVSGEPIVDEKGAHNSTHLFACLITFVEKLGFLGGLLAPVVFIAIILGAATVVGYINFTFFH